MDDPDVLHIDKKADMLQAMFQHYADVGLDHQRQAATTSNILLFIVGAILALVGIDEQVIGLVDGLAASSVAIIGGFGMVWSWKQHEKYSLWTNVAKEYQKDLAKLMTKLKLVSDLEEGSRSITVKDFGVFTARKLELRYLWVTLHGLVMALGIGLAVTALWKDAYYVVAVITGLVLFTNMAAILNLVVNVQIFRERKTNEQ